MEGADQPSYNGRIGVGVAPQGKGTGDGFLVGGAPMEMVEGQGEAPAHKADGAASARQPRQPAGAGGGGAARTQDPHRNR